MMAYYLKHVAFFILLCMLCMIVLSKQYICNCITHQGYVI